MMIQMTMTSLPRSSAARPALLAPARHHAGSAVQVLFRAPKPGEDVPEDIRRALEEDEALDERDERPLTAPNASWSAGMALCVPSLMLMGLLYTLLK